MRRGGTYARRGGFCAIALMALAFLFLAMPRAEAQGTPETQGAEAGPATRPTARSVAEVQGAIEAIRKELEDAETTAARRTVSSEELLEQRFRVESLVPRLQELIARLEPQEQSIQSILDQLGPAPSGDAPPEPPELAQSRDQHTEALAAVDGALRTARLLLTQAEELSQDIAQQRRARFARTIGERSDSVLNPTLWLEAASDLPSAFQTLGMRLSAAMARADLRLAGSDIMTLVLALAAALVLFVVLRALLHRYLPSPDLRTVDNTVDPESEASAAVGDGAPGARLPYLGRAALTVLGEGIIPIVSMLIVYFAMRSAGLLPPQLAALALAAIAAIGSFVFHLALARAICAPLRPGLRLVPISDAAASAVVASVALLGIVTGGDLLVDRLNELAISPISLEISQQSVFSLLVMLIVAYMLRRLSAGLSQAGEVRDEASLFWSWVRNLVWFILIAIALALVTGYIAFANFLATQIAFAGTILALLWLLLALVDELISAVIAPRSRVGSGLASTFGTSPEGLAQIAVLSSGLVRLVLILLAMVLILLPWGFDTLVWANWIRTAFFGFQVAGINISLSSILAALLFFVLAYVATRAIQRWLADRYLPHTRLDVSLRNSIRIVVGYVGVALAALIALASLGVGLDNLALVAGALSVGIGFGLQSIVNNFVSGLILLAERPIKEGDWIMVGAEEGYVRRISIRATEIETFDRATVIVPNSDLITGTVKNRMHAGMTGRLSVSVRVEYDADAEHVRSLLFEEVRAHPKILAYPEPAVLLSDFGDSGLSFTLYAFVGDLNDAFTTASDLRFAVLKRFREEGITIPFPQSDLNIRGLDGIETLLPPSGRSGAAPEGGTRT